MKQKKHKENIQLQNRALHTNATFAIVLIDGAVLNFIIQDPKIC